MPTKRLSKPSQHTDSKENAIGTLIKQVGDSGSMGRRKRSRSVPGDANRDSGQAQAADRNESQEDDDGDDDDREAEATEDTNPQNGSEGRIRRHVNAAKLYALASGNCKRLKTDREPVEGQTQDHQVITVNVKVVNAGGSQPPANASVATTEPAQKTVSAGASRLSLKHWKSEQPATDGASSLTKHNGVAQDGDVKTSSQTGESLLSAPVLKQSTVAPALNNLGNTCYLNSIVQVLYYTPWFYDNMRILNQEMRQTVSDYNIINKVTPCENALRAHCNFIMSLTQLFAFMRISEQQAMKGNETSPISPCQLLSSLERRSSLFRGQEQQDSHEFLRCILHYIQEAIRAISQQRALHHDVITSRSSSVDSNSHPSSASVAEILAEQSPQPDSVSPTAIASTMNEVFPTSPVQDCLISSLQPTSGSSHDLKPRVSNTSQSAASTTPYGAKRTSSVGKITNYFVAASPEPKTASELVVTTTKLADFVEAMYEGKIERSTRCSVCECSTRCTETFQDIEVVAQKAIIPVKASISDSFISDDDDDDNGQEKSWIVRSMEEMELLCADNKYWCAECLHHEVAQRSVVYQQLPHILTIHIKRFAGFGGGAYTKCMTCVDVPFVLPCLEATCLATGAKSKRDKHQYKLYAVVCHSGISLSAGHYISYVRTSARHADTSNIPNGTTSSMDPESGDEEESAWLYCNDDVVVALPEREVKRKLSAEKATTPYMLFYQRMLASS